MKFWSKSFNWWPQILNRSELENDNFDTEQLAKKLLETNDATSFQNLLETFRKRYSHESMKKLLIEYLFWWKDKKVAWWDPKCVQIMKLKSYYWTQNQWDNELKQTLESIKHVCDKVPEEVEDAYKKIYQEIEKAVNEYFTPDRISQALYKTQHLIETTTDKQVFKRNMRNIWLALITALWVWAWVWRLTSWNWVSTPTNAYDVFVDECNSTLASNMSDTDKDACKKIWK